MLPLNLNLSDADGDDEYQPESLNYSSCKQLDVHAEVAMHTNVPI